MYNNITDLDERKPNANNILANLPDDGQRRIHEWLQTNSYEDTVELIAALRPEGLGLKVHYTSLRNYYRRFIHPDRVVRRSMLLDSYRDMAEMAIDDPVPFMVVVAEGLYRHLADLSLEPKPGLNDLERLFRIYQKIQDMDLKRERLTLAKSKTSPMPQAAELAASPTAESASQAHNPAATSRDNKEYQETPVIPPMAEAPEAQTAARSSTDGVQTRNALGMREADVKSPRVANNSASPSTNIKEYQETTFSDSIARPPSGSKEPSPIKEYQALANLQPRPQRPPR